MDIGFNFHLFSPLSVYLNLCKGKKEGAQFQKGSVTFVKENWSYIWCNLQCTAVHRLTAAPITALVPWERQRLHSLSQQDCTTAFSVIDGTRGELWLRLSHGNNVPEGRRKVNYQRKWGLRTESSTEAQWGFMSFKWVAFSRSFILTSAACYTSYLFLPRPS